MWFLKQNEYKKTNIAVNSSPDKLLEMKETVEKLKSIIDTLPEQQKTVIELRDRDGYTFDEIAEIMKMNAVNVRVCLSRARKKVRELLQKTYEYGSGKDKRITEEIL